MTPNRIVVLLTPIFASLAGWIAQWVADSFPGTPDLDEGELTAVFVAGALAATAAAAQWLRGWSKHEETQALIEMQMMPSDAEMSLSQEADKLGD